ncbi:MAG: PLP-dependent aminotransferase family protein [Alphaproteobacteria bacterium]|nr:PLP-dependent aminotransferase family protein [Alphaproteobacteria bacterium]
MPRASWIDHHPWIVDRTGDVPLYRQVYQQLRDAIANGAISPGDRLPSTRRLAETVGVARAVIVTAFELLLAENVIAGKVGSGTYVADDLPHDLTRRRRRPSKSDVKFDVPPHLRDGFLEHATAHDDRPFATGRTLLDPRSAKVWRRLTQRAVRDIGPIHLGYADPRGAADLRSAICTYLRTARGVRAEPDQVIVTTGAQQAVDLAIRVLMRPGDEAWVEDPGYPLTTRALQAAHVRLKPIAVDAYGIDVAEGIRRAAKARAAFVTPSHQFPTGVVMSLSRRLELLAWARERKSWIIEDDYVSEYRYSGKPLSSLQGLDDAGRVIYVGTLNKALFPGLRMGYLVAPPELVAAMVGTRYLTDRQPASLTQAMVTAFISEGHFATHLRRTRAAYAEQRDTLADTLKAHANDLLDVRVPDQGLHLVAYLKRHRSDIRLEPIARQSGIIVRAMSRLYLAGTPRQALMLGFSGFPPESLRPAAKKLAALLHSL